MKILVLHGPNLNMLEYRNKAQYGTLTFAALQTLIKETIEEQTQDATISFVQSNHEGDLVDAIQDSIKSDFDVILLNAGAYSHYSIAIRDALEMSHALRVEVHLSDVKNREGFRANLMTGEVCDAIFSGKKEQSYVEAISWIFEKENEHEKNN